MAEGGKTVDASKTTESILTNTQISQILDALKRSSDYVVLTKGEYDALKHTAPATSTPIVKEPVVKPKITVADRFNTSVVNSMFDRSSFQMPSIEMKLPFFSGEQTPLKGDVTYDVWRYEVKYLLSNTNLSQAVGLQVIHRSLRGAARQILIPLGEMATMTDVLQKLDTLFGNVSTNESIMQTFYSELQKPKESVTTYGCRLETLLQVAVESGHVSREGRNDMLRSKFWTGLRDEKLRLLTRHKYDSVISYDRLLGEVRAVEQELMTTEKVSTAQHQAVSVEKDKAVEELAKKMDTMMLKMQSLEQQMRDRPKADNTSNFNSFSESRGYSGYRGNYRDRDRNRGSRNYGNHGDRNVYRDSSTNNTNKANPKA